MRINYHGAAHSCCAGARRVWGNAQCAATILVVDDDALVLENAAAMLEDMGHRVRRAGSAAAALDLLAEEGAVDLVVTDQAMPGMTGLELAAFLRARRAELPVLLVSGLVDIDPAQLGDLAVLAKPFTQEKLAAGVRKVLGSGKVVPIGRRRRREP